MSISRRQLLLASSTLLAPTLIHAQDKPPIRILMGLPPGGGTDSIARYIAEKLREQLGQPVIIESRVGVGGRLAADALMSANPDGLTYMIAPNATPTFQTLVFGPQLKWNIWRDFAPVAGLVSYPLGMAVNADLGVKNVREFVQWTKANPGKVEYGSTGTGTTPHLAIEEFSQKAGIELNHIPYKGSAELMQAILGGHIRVMSGTTEFAPLVKEGKLRLLATLGRNRTKAFPDIPTVKESGWDTITESPFGIGGPKGMDPAVVRVLHDAFKKTLEDPKVLDTLDRFFQPVIYMGTEEYTRYGARTFEAERATIERLGLAKKS